ncbi:HEAT repeat domain-containing protein [Streptomyces mashuensis]|nr:HEAT repeat domain-containing protein [Streptomyces mashuensis]
MTSAEPEHPLLAAVRTSDTAAMAALLEPYDSPHARGPHLAAALRLAADALDQRALDALLLLADAEELGLNAADADGRTPLLRAVARGAHDIALALHFAGSDPRARDREGRDALALARPHPALLTHFEWTSGIATPFAELLARALTEPDVDHPVWGATTVAAASRKGPRALRLVLDAAATLQHHPDPLARCFGAEVLRLINLYDQSGEEEESPFDTLLVDLFLPWAAREEDPRVLRPLTTGLAEAMEPRAEEPMPGLTRHADAQVRAAAVGGLHWPVRQGRADALAAALACTRDTDAQVREAACRALLNAPADDPAPSDALAARLADPEEAVRITAAIRLALRDDPRGDDLLDALDRTIDRTSPYYWDMDQVRRHRRNR